VLVKVEKEDPKVLLHVGVYTQQVQQLGAMDKQDKFQAAEAAEAVTLKALRLEMEQQAQVDLLLLFGRQIDEKFCNY
jgi:hypothetical protein